MNHSDRSRFFILGCQRTGTTLMRLVLECHSKIFCFDEQRAYQELSNKNPDALHYGKTTIGFKIPCWTEELDEPNLTACGFGVEAETARFYRQEPIVFMLRDVRDAVASMLKLNLEGDEDWIDRCAIPILESKIHSSRKFRDRFAREIRQARSSAQMKMAMAALYWKYKTVAFFEYLDEGWPVLGVRYEDLVSCPETQLRRVVAFLGLEWEPSLLAHPAFRHTELYATGLAIGGTDPQRPIDAKSLDSWKQILSSEEVDEIMGIAGDTMARTLT